VSQSQQILLHGRILRYELHERLTHWVAAFSYIYLLLTGLAFYSPWLFWIAILLGGGQISRMLHPWAGLIFFLAVMKMYSMWGGANAHHRCGQSLVERGWPLRTQ
jgi:formate dehydrogenase gamma subunit